MGGAMAHVPRQRSGHSVSGPPNCAERQVSNGDGICVGKAVITTAVGNHSSIGGVRRRVLVSPRRRLSASRAALEARVGAVRLLFFGTARAAAITV
jgi:hypothetical protein